MALTAAPAQEAPIDDARIQQILKWLPIETETLVVSRGPAELSEIDIEKVNLEDLFWALPTSPLHEIAKGKYLHLLKGKKAAFVIEASCQFRRVQADGPVYVSKYGGCHILVFDDLGEIGMSLMKSAINDAAKVTAIANHSVVHFEKRLGPKDSQSLLLAHPKPNILLIGADRDYLLKLLTRMTGETKSQAFPDSLDVWKRFDPNARYWAIRRYLSKDEGGDATALLYAYSPNETQRIRLRIGFATQVFQDDLRVQRKLKVVEPGVVEFDIRFNDGAKSRFLLLLMSELGHEFTI